MPPAKLPGIHSHRAPPRRALRRDAVFFCLTLESSIPSNKPHSSPSPPSPFKAHHQRRSCYSHFQRPCAGALSVPPLVPVAAFWSLPFAAFLNSGVNKTVCRAFERGDDCGNDGRRFLTPPAAARRFSNRTRERRTSGSSPFRIERS